MGNFTRAIGVMARRPLPVVGSIGCSLMVAALWGGNIGVFYPVFEVALRGQSVQQWQQTEIAEIEAQIVGIEKEITVLESTIAEENAGNEPDGKGAETKLVQLNEEKVSQEKRIARRRAWLAYADVLPNDAFKTVVVLVAVVLAMTILKHVFLVGNLVCTTYAVQQASVAIQSRYVRHVTRLDLGSYDRLGVSQLVTSFTEALEHVTRGLHILLGTSVREPLKIIACAIGAALISWRMLLFALITAPLAALLIGLLGKRIRGTMTAQVSDSIYLNKLVFETISALPLVQAFTMERETDKRIEAAANERMRRTVKTSFYIALSKPVVEVLGIASIGAALLAGSYLMINQETSIFGIRMIDHPLSVGQMLTFFGLLVGMSDPARKLSEVFSILQVSSAAADRIYAVMDTDPSVTDPENPTTLPAIRGDISLEGVTFGYQPEHTILHDVNLSVDADETIAIVGRNGCGKSTLAKLMLRYYDAEEGQVRLDGVDVDRLSLEQLRGSMAVVPQHATLFDDTIANNIRYGRPDATLAEVAAAARQARADEFIEDDLPDGYETRIGHDGQNLSGGQRQRIALARAILRDPRVLILDEATSQIDMRSEVLMRDALEEFVAERACIIITHRTAFLTLADRIVVMDSGRVVDIGSDEELRSRCHAYQSLFGSPSAPQPALSA